MFFSVAVCLAFYQIITIHKMILCDKILCVFTDFSDLQYGREKKGLLCIVLIV